MTGARIPLSDPDITQAELDAVAAALGAERVSQGPGSEAFEQEFAAHVGRRHALAVSSGTLGLFLVLKAHGIGAGDEVVTTAYSWRETAHAIRLTGAEPVFVEVDYWSGVIVPEKIPARLTAHTRAILACNTNGHPAPWGPLRALARERGLILLEDSTEAVGSMYQQQIVGSFGDCSVFDFSQPGPLCCGEGGMIVTDDGDIAAQLRHLRHRRAADRTAPLAGGTIPLQAGMSDLAAALGRVQLGRIDQILERRKHVERLYFEHVKSFEGIKDPYVAPEVSAVHWFLYLVHLGTRFSRSSRDAIVEDLRRENIEAYPYSQPLHLQRAYVEAGPATGHGRLLVSEKLADRAIALPFHCHLTPEQVAFIVSTMKDASTNVGAGAAIYL